jgi:excisionase family DNA binding protein
MDPIIEAAASASSPWLTPSQAAQYLQTSENTLRSWRCIGRGPRFHKVGARCVRYHRDQLDEFVRQSRGRS